MGKSKGEGRRRCNRPGHPHAGGEIFADGAEDDDPLGPSPRGWGNRHGGPDHLQFSRAIPTRVGKSYPASLDAGRMSGHPHAGGEIRLGLNQSEAEAGPSPRGWGNPARTGARSSLARAIPTRVGKSPPPSAAPIAGTGHPHAGGEILAEAARMTHRHGPSPRGWGNPPRPTKPPEIFRAIPTRVGKSVCHSSPGLRVTGHPHAGGEIHASRFARFRHGGPSPRGWGNRR